MERIGKEKVSEKDENVIFSIIKDLFGFLIPCLEGISRYSRPKREEECLGKLWIF